MAPYIVTCPCGYQASRPTLGQAASEFMRHAEANPGPRHAVTIHRSLSAPHDSPPARPPA